MLEAKTVLGRDLLKTAKSGRFVSMIRDHGIPQAACRRTDETVRIDQLVYLYFASVRWGSRSG